MQINAALNLAFPIRSDDAGNPTIWAYHTPINRVVFEASYRLIAATKAALFSKGIGYAADAGPRIAALALMDAARQDAIERGDVSADNVPNVTGALALLADIKRLTMVLAPGPQGFDLLPVDAAVSRGVIDDDDWREVEAAIVFFTCGYAMAAKAKRQQTADAVASILMGSITSLQPMEFAASLRTSTPVVSSEPAPQSSVPS
jgi:hypothetical protein